MEEVTEMLVTAAAASNDMVEELKEECWKVVSELKDAVEEVVTSLGSVEEGMKVQGDVGGRCSVRKSGPCNRKKTANRTDLDRFGPDRQLPVAYVSD